MNATMRTEAWGIFTKRGKLMFNEDIADAMIFKKKIEAMETTKLYPLSDGLRVLKVAVLRLEG